MSYRDAFPWYVDGAMIDGLVARGWVGVSHESNAMPHLLHPSEKLALWVDSLDAGNMKYPENKRFTLCELDSRGDDRRDVCESDSIGDIMRAAAQWLEQEHARSEVDRFSPQGELDALVCDYWVACCAQDLRDALCRWYEAAVGYRPDDDEPSLWTEQIREEIHAYLRVLANESGALVPQNLY